MRAVVFCPWLLSPSLYSPSSGLIIGPRGNTQKRMERETDCKIAIRGKGSVKEGARRGPMAIDEDDELHVYVSGETEEAVEKVPPLLLKICSSWCHAPSCGKSI